MIRLRVSTLLLLGSAACSWDRFEQLKVNPPVEILSAPADRANAFGTAVSAARLDDRALALVASVPHGPPATLYVLGTNETPTTDALDKDHCVATPLDKVCSVIEQPASLARAWAPKDAPRELCFVSGVGLSHGQQGLWTRCADHSEYVFPLPTDLVAAFTSPLTAGGQPPPLRLAADRSASPLLLAAASKQGRAWYYEPLAGEPIDLVPSGNPGAGWGSSVVVVGGNEASLLAIGAAESGEVWLFRATGAVVESLGCVSGGDEFGRALGAGDVDGDGLPDLAVSDAKQVHVLSGAELAGLAAQADAVCNPALVSTLAVASCKNNDDTEGCGSSDFGSALVVADLDGDGTSEVAVGAPNMTVRQVEKAGAVLVYDGTGKLIDTRILSDNQPAARFGASLATVSQGTPGKSAFRDVLIVGTPGSGQTSLVYCATVAGSGVSARCESL